VFFGEGRGGGVGRMQEGWSHQGKSLQRLQRRDAIRMDLPFDVFDFAVYLKDS
jgi:hypothetical protein